jgi:hypothetical protein
VGWKTEQHPRTDYYALCNKNINISWVMSQNHSDRGYPSRPEFPHFTVFNFMLAISNTYLFCIKSTEAISYHIGTYFAADFASLVWSPSGDKIAYIAEERVPKSEPFLPLKKPDSDSGKPVTKVK